MLDQTLTLPEDPEELRSFTARLLAEVKAQAILIEPEGRVRLAPFYDMASMLPYLDDVHPRELRMSMKIGGEYRWDAVRDRHWERVREEMGLG